MSKQDDYAAGDVVPWDHRDERGAPRPPALKLPARGWRTDAAPRGMRCLVTVILPTWAGPFVGVATLSPDHDGEVWLSGTARIPKVIAWMPAPEPAEPTGLGTDDKTQLEADGGSHRDRKTDEATRMLEVRRSSDADSYVHRTIAPVPDAERIFRSWFPKANVWLLHETYLVSVGAGFRPTGAGSTEAQAWSSACAFHGIVGLNQDADDCLEARKQAEAFEGTDSAARRLNEAAFSMSHSAARISELEELSAAAREFASADAFWEIQRLRTRWNAAQLFVEAAVEVWNETETPEFDRARVRELLKPVMDKLSALHDTISDEKVRESLRASECTCSRCLEKQAHGVVVVTAGETTIALCQECAPNVADEIYNKQWQLRNSAPPRDEVTSQEAARFATYPLGMLLDELIECTVRWHVGPLEADKCRIATALLERLAALGIARKAHRIGCEIWSEYRLCACPWEVPS